MSCNKSYKCILILLPLFLCILLPFTASADPLANWEEVTSPSDNMFYGMTYGNGTFVTVGNFGTIITSTDGVAWSSPIETGSTNHLLGVGFGNGTFLAVGTNGTILTSADGTTWVDRSIDISDELYNAAYGNGLYVVVGASGAIFTSSGGPGWTWFNRSLAISNWLFGTVYGLSTFVDVGSSGKILTSSNGTSWPAAASGTTRHLWGVSYGSGKFVAVGQKGTILTSTNGTTWTVRRGYDLDPDYEFDPYYNDLYGVAYGVVNSTGYFVAVGQYGTLLTSPETDLATWTQRDSGTTYDLEAVAFDSTYNAFAAVGGYGIIVLDGDSLPTHPVRVWQPHDIYFDSIQNAYDNLTGDLIECMALHFNGNLAFNDNKSFTLRGGFDSTFTDNPSSTTINGTVTVSSGMLVVENLVVQ
jgi:hypothetical protein